MLVMSDNDDHQFGIDPEQIVAISTMYVEDKKGNPYRQLVVYCKDVGEVTLKIDTAERITDAYHHLKKLLGQSE